MATKKKKTNNRRNPEYVKQININFTEEQNAMIDKSVENQSAVLGIKVHRNDYLRALIVAAVTLHSDP